MPSIIRSNLYVTLIFSQLVHARPIIRRTVNFANPQPVDVVLLPPLITLEEHYLSPDITPTPADLTGAMAYFNSTLLAAELNELGAGRIAEMDAGSVAIQVLSENPVGYAPPANCTAANNGLAAAVALHPTRFAGFATLPMEEPAAAAAELERCVTDLAFKGALIAGHLNNGTYFDSSDFYPLWAAAERLNVPIYLHPAFPNPAQEAMFAGNYTAMQQFGLSTFMWGWHQETGLHFLRLFAAGVFDLFPNLQIILGHDGEMVPFMLDRAERFASSWPPMARNLSTVWAENIWVTTSGMLSLPPFQALLGTTDPSRIMYSVDYPYGTTQDGAAFMRELMTSGLVTSQEFQGIAYQNAEKLLRVKVT